MSEQELVEENERLRRELAAMTKSRDRFREWLCQAFGLETDPDVLEKELQEMLVRMETRPSRDVHGLLRDILPAQCATSMETAQTRREMRRCPRVHEERGHAMPFQIDMKQVLETKISRLAELSTVGVAAPEFWNDLSNLLQDVAQRPLELGEEVYEYKHGKYQSRILVRGSLAIQFAVNEEHRAIFVERLTISGINHYPREVEEILNHEPF